MKLSRLADLLGRLPVTLLLFGAVVAAFGLELALGGADSLATLVRLGALHVGRVVEHGEAWRLITAMFLHAGWVHVVLNTLALVQLAALVELLFGSRRLLGFYLICGLVGNLSSALFNPETHGVGAVGASGALFGLVGLIMGVALYGREHWRERLERPLRSLSLAVSFSLSLLVAQLVLGLPILIDHWAHAGGFVAGLLLAAAYPEPMTRTTAAEGVLAWVSLGLMVGSGALAGLFGARALPGLAADVDRAWEARLDAADEGFAKAALVANLLPVYRDVGAPDPEGAFRAALAGCSPETLFAVQAALYGEGGRDDEILWTLEQWVALEPDDPDANNGLAWTLLVHPDAARRDPARALRHADRGLGALAALTEPPPGNAVDRFVARWLLGDFEARRSSARAAFLDTRAEALRQLGRIDEALAAQREAVALGAAHGSPAQEEMEARLAALEAEAADR